MQIPGATRLIVFNEGSLYRHVQSFVDYYHENRTHLSLEKDTPGRRPVQPPESGQVIAMPQRRKPIMLGSLLVTLCFLGSRPRMR